jgi:hypothetical protein
VDAEGVSAAERDIGHRGAECAGDQRAVAVEHGRPEHRRLQRIAPEQLVQVGFMLLRNGIFRDFRRQPRENGIRPRCIVLEVGDQDLRDVFRFPVEFVFDAAFEVDGAEHAQRQHNSGEYGAHQRNRRARESGRREAFF